jgi:hypothetical protein
VFGPKIGNGFLQNLLGDFSRLTMDRWFVRTGGRYTGTLGRDDAELLEGQIKRFHDELVREGHQPPKDLLKLFDVVAQVDANWDRRSGYTNGTELEKAGRGLFKTITGPQDAPGSAGRRDLWRTVGKNVLHVLHRQGHRTIEMADLQGLLWFPEKALYRKLGYRDPKGAALADYHDAFHKIARANGFSDDQVDAAVAREARQSRTGGNV